MVVVGSDLGRLAEQIAAADREHQQQLKDEKLRHAAFLRQIDELNRELEKQGLSKDERGKIVTAAKVRSDNQLVDLEQRIKAAGRKNRAAFDQTLQQTLRRLYHEAFHAYLENYVYPRAEHDVPRWLNEGLAQIFEAGLLDADTLRVDAPTPQQLARLQGDLASNAPLSLAALLTAEPGAFLVPHRSDGLASEQHYLYSWGLAYYVTFQMSLLGTAGLDRYVAPLTNDASDPIARFEKLAGMRLDAFERQWRRHMASLKPSER